MTQPIDFAVIFETFKISRSCHSDLKHFGKLQPSTVLEIVPSVLGAGAGKVL